MRKRRIEADGAPVLLAALIYFVADLWQLAAFIFPVFVHEFGHIFAIKLLGLRISGFHAELKGLCIRYQGYASPLGQALCAAAGPMAGLIYAMAASVFGSRLGSSWLELSAGVSLLLSIFNLLPALPLDGGHILYSLALLFCGETAAAKLTNLIGLAIGAVLLVLGAYLMIQGFGVALELAAIWLLSFTGLNCHRTSYYEMI